MAVRVELLDEAVADLAEYAESGNIRLFMKKLVELEQAGAAYGQPLGANLTTWRKIVLGNRDWRIVYRLSLDEKVATVCVVGDRDDAACYEQASKRVQSGEDTETQSLAEAMLVVFSTRKERRKAGKKKKG